MFNDLKAVNNGIYEILNELKSLKSENNSLWTEKDYKIMKIEEKLRVLNEILFNVMSLSSDSSELNITCTDEPVN